MLQFIFQSDQSKDLSATLTLEEMTMANSTKKRMLLAVDGSEQAMEAVRYVSLLMPPQQMEIVLFHVMTKIPESFWDLEKEPAFYHKFANIRAWEIQQQRIIQEFMDGATQLLVDAGIPRESFKTVIQVRKEGIARDLVVESRNNYHAVVLGRTGLSELKDLVLGSIANKLMEKITHIPVWIVGGTPKPEKVLVSVDVSESSIKVVDYVASVLAGSQANVLLFHAVRGFDIFQRGQTKSFVPDHSKDWLEVAEKELQEASKAIKPVFEQAEKRLISAGISADKVSSKIVTGVGSRAGAIITEAQEGGMDTIVVGRRGLSKVQEFFMGRVSNKVIQMARKMAVWVVS
jgi:nucleotide-binding universal stress UspA family protein